MKGAALGAVGGVGGRGLGRGAVAPEWQMRQLQPLQRGWGWATNQRGWWPPPNSAIMTRHAASYVQHAICNVGMGLAAC